MLDCIACNFDIDRVRGLLVQIHGNRNRRAFVFRLPAIPDYESVEAPWRIGGGFRPGQMKQIVIAPLFVSPHRPGRAFSIVKPDGEVRVLVNVTVDRTFEQA